jgi:hypothetical protein
MASKAETAFREKYPNARVEVEKVLGTLKVYHVYAGDYPCASSVSKMQAFRNALQHEQAGDITPDPNEVAATSSR